MVSHEIIEFLDKRPSIEHVIHYTSLSTGISITYDYEIKKLSASEIGGSMFIYEGDHNEYYITVFVIDDVPTNYLVDAVIFALLQLGGKYDEELPVWANLTWVEAKTMM